MRQARERDIHRAALAALFQAMWNAFKSEPHTAGEIIEYAQTGEFKKSKLLDRPLNGGDTDLKAAIVGYISGKLEAQHFGNKLGIDRDRIVGDLRLASDYDDHRKVNRWFIEKLR
jgi:hypothetical protein